MTTTFVPIGQVNNLINKLKRSVTYIPVTDTQNPLSGEETLTDGSSELISVVFFKTNSKWSSEYEGLLEGGDAFIVAPSTITLSRDDKIQVDNQIYRIHDTLNYYADDNNNTLVYSFSNCFKID